MPPEPEILSKEELLPLEVANLLRFVFILQQEYIRMGASGKSV